MAIGSFAFAVAKDADNKREYLVSNTEEEIEQYCKNNLKIDFEPKLYIRAPKEPTYRKITAKCDI